VITTPLEAFPGVIVVQSAGQTQISGLPATASASLEEENAVRQRILIVEDNKADVFLIREALRFAELDLHLNLVADGEQAIRFINETDADDQAPCPDLVLLDLNLPRRHGLEVLDHLRRSGKCASAQVLIVTSSDSTAERREANRLGANGYFRKPSGYDEYLKLGDVVKGMLAHPPGQPT
jgi:CheY-like chemotaxis protein